MQAHHIGRGHQLVQAGERAGVAQRQLGGGVKKHHVHAQRFRQHRKLRADGAIADDAQRLAADLVGMAGRFQPAAAVRHGVFFGYAAHQQNRLGQHQLGHRAGIGKRRVEHRDAPLARRGQVHLVGADAKAAHRSEAVGVAQHLGGELGARADAHKMRVGDLGLELVVGQGAGQAFDLAVARRAQHVDGRRVDAFEQQEADLVLVGRCFGGGWGGGQEALVHS